MSRITRPQAALVGVLIAFVVGVLWFSQRSATPAEGAVRVAAILSLSGPAARFDAVKKQTMEVALRRIREEQPALNLELEFFDAGGSPDAAQAAIRRAIASGASYILTGTSPNALAAAEMVRGRTPPIVQIGNAANPAFGPPRSGEYRFWPDWKQEAALVADLLRREKRSRVFVIHSADPYSDALLAAFRANGEAEPTISIADLRYDPAGTPDFRPALARARTEGREALVVFGLPPGIAALMAQLADVRWTAPVVGGVNTNLAVSMYDSLGLHFPLWAVQTEAMAASMPTGSEAATFRQIYDSTHHAVPAFHALYLADALYFIAEAWRSNPARSIDEVIRTNGVVAFDGASGHITFDADRALRLVMKVNKVR